MCGDACWAIFLKGRQNRRRPSQLSHRMAMGRLTADAARSAPDCALQTQVPAAHQCHLLNTHCPPSQLPHQSGGRLQRKQQAATHILESLLGAPPVTLATRRAASSAFRSWSCCGSLWWGRQRASERCSDRPVLAGCCCLSLLAPNMTSTPSTHLRQELLLVLAPQLMSLDPRCESCRKKRQQQMSVCSGPGGRSEALKLRNRDQ